MKEGTPKTWRFGYSIHNFKSPTCWLPATAPPCEAGARCSSDIPLVCLAALGCASGAYLGAFTAVGATTPVAVKSGGPCPTPAMVATPGGAVFWW